MRSSGSRCRIYRALRNLGFLHMSARPNAYKRECRGHGRVQKNFVERVAEIRAQLAPDTGRGLVPRRDAAGPKEPAHLSLGQKGSRPGAAHEQSTQSTYLIGAGCPERAGVAALVLPACNTQARQLHLDEIAAKITPGAHAILLLDQAEWHSAKVLKVSEQYLTLAAPATRTRTQRPRKYLAIHAAELVVEPNFQILRRHRRSLLLRLEHAHRSAVENHVNRPPRSLNLRIGIIHRVATPSRQPAALGANMVTDGARYR